MQQSGDQRLLTEIQQQVNRRQQAEKCTQRFWLSGMGMMGMIGWSVVVPTLLFALLGRWLDQHYPINHSWTLTLIVAGLCIGCWLAWRWVSLQDCLMHKTDHSARGQ